MQSRGRRSPKLWQLRGDVPLNSMPRETSKSVSSKTVPSLQFRVRYPDTARGKHTRKLQHFNECLSKLINNINILLFHSRVLRKNTHSFSPASELPDAFSEWPVKATPKKENQRLTFSNKNYTENLLSRTLPSFQQSHRLPLKFHVKTDFSPFKLYSPS